MALLWFVRMLYKNTLPQWFPGEAQSYGKGAATIPTWKQCSPAAPSWISVSENDSFWWYVTKYGETLLGDNTHTTNRKRSPLISSEMNLLPAMSSKISILKTIPWFHLLWNLPHNGLVEGQSVNKDAPCEETVQRLTSLQISGTYHAKIPGSIYSMLLPCLLISSFLCSIYIHFCNSKGDPAEKSLGNTDPNINPTLTKPLLWPEVQGSKCPLK